MDLQNNAGARIPKILTVIFLGTGALYAILFLFGILELSVSEFLWFGGYIMILMLLVSVYYGLIGPKWLREPMRRFTKWEFYGTSLFFPLDPYKPLPQALREGVRNFFPTRERAKQWLFFGLFELAVIIMLTITMVVSLAFGKTGLITWFVATPIVIMVSSFAFSRLFLR